MATEIFIRKNPNSPGKPALALSLEGVISPKAGFLRVNQNIVGILIFFWQYTLSFVYVAIEHYLGVIVPRVAVEQEPVA